MRLVHKDGVIDKGDVVLLVKAAGAAVADRSTRDREELELIHRRRVEGVDPRGFYRLSPHPLQVVDDKWEVIAVPGVVRVVPDGRAVTGSGTRDGRHDCIPSRIESGAAGHLSGAGPHVVRLVDNEGLHVMSGILVVAAPTAVARRRARHCVDGRLTTRIERGGSRYLSGRSPDATGLVCDERFVVTGAVTVLPSSGTVARRPACERCDLGIPT